MAKLTMVQAINQGLMQEMEHDKTVVVLGEDVGKDGGVFRVTEGLLDRFGEKRVIDTPLAESAIVGCSIGMAANGLKPVAEVQFSGFLYYAYHQLEAHASRIRNRSRGRFTCPMVVRAPYGGGIRALEHHSESKEAIYAHTPGLKVVMPSTPYDAKGLLISSIRDPDPVIFLEPKRIYRSVKQEVPDDSYEIPLGKANIIKEGSGCTLVSWGATMKACLEAVEELEKDGKSIEVIDLRTISPLDEQTIIESVKKTGRLVIAHEAHRMLGLGAEISAVVNERCLLSLEAPIVRVTGYDIIFPLFELENEYLPSVKRIIDGVNTALSF